MIERNDGEEQTMGADNEDERFAGKVAFVTGAASGIGRAAALAFARKGAGVVCPSSDDLRQRPGLRNGGSGSRMEAMRPGRDAASGDWRWSGV